MHSTSWWFRLLVAVYPPSREGDFGAERLELIEARFRRAREEGARLRFGYDLLRDTATALPTAWLRFLRREFSTMMHFGFNDMRLGARFMTRHPVSWAVAVVTLAIGIGASSALFSVVDGVLLRPLPYPDSDRLVTLWNQTPESGVDRDWFAPAHFDFLRRNLRSVEGLALFSGGETAASLEEGPAEYVRYLRSTPELMTLIGARPLLGRILQPEDGAGDASAVGVLTYSGWTGRFGSDPDVLGRTVRIGSLPVEIVGVLDESARIVPETVPTVGTLRSVELVVNRNASASFLENVNSWNYNIMGRLAPGATLAQVQSELAGLLPDFKESYSIDASSFAITAVPVLADVVAGTRGIILALFGASGLVLLIACGNVATLLLARGERRTGEFGVRRALGAGTGRLGGQLVGEQLFVALPAGLLGLVLAHLGLGVLIRHAPDGLPRVDEVGMDARVLAFAIVLSLVVTLLIGLVPALRARRVEPTAALRGFGRGGSRLSGGLRPSASFGTGMSVVQIALSIVVLVGAGLLVRSYSAILRVDPGFDTSGVLTMRVSLGISPPPSEERWPMVREMIRRVETLPGVREVGVSNLVPLGSAVAWGGVEVEGQEPGTVVSELRAASPDYFESMGIEVVEGRTFESGELDDAAAVAIVDQEFVDRYWRGLDPIGRIVAFGADSLRVVGVVENIRQHRLDAKSARSFVYFPYSGFATSGIYLTVQTPSAAESLVGPVRAAVLDAVPNAVLSEVFPVADRVGIALASRRYGVTLIVLFAGIAVLLAGTGTYSLVAFRIAGAQREIGLRAALGADRRRLATVVCRFGVWLGIAGVVLGVPIAYLASRLLESQLYGVRPADPTTFVLTVIGTLGMALAATGLPAVRAARTDPARILREG